MKLAIKDLQDLLAYIQATSADVSVRLEISTETASVAFVFSNAAGYLQKIILHDVEKPMLAQLVQTGRLGVALAELKKSGGPK